MAYTHLFVDLDNTIFDFNASSEIALSYVAEILKLEYDDTFKEVYHKHNHEVWKLLELGSIDTMTLRRQRFERTAEAFGKKVDGMLLNRVYLSQLVKNPRFMTGAEEFLAYASERYTLVAATNGLKEVQRPRLHEVKFNTYFSQIVVSDEIGIAKPDVRYFEHAWEISGRPDKDRILMIGDNPQSDIAGGKAFGIDTCLLDPHDKHTEEEATYKARNLDEVRIFI